MVDRFQRFSYAIFEFSRCWHKIAAQEMAQYGLKGPHCVYLLTLHRHADGITATKLGQLCGKDKADVSRMMTMMENKGLVYKEGRAYRAMLKLTESGKKAAEQVQARAAKAVALGESGLTQESREIFYETLELVLTNLQMISEEGLPQ